jgi:hypothetical protein
MMMRPEPTPVRRLLRPVSTYRHAAPAPRMSSRAVGEKQRAGRAVAGLHVRKVFRADKTRQRFPDRKKKRLRRTPPAHDLKLKSGWLHSVLQRDPAENLVALQETDHTPIITAPSAVVDIIGEVIGATAVR